MSPYGKSSSARVFHQLPATSYDSGIGSRISVHHVDLSSGAPALIDFLHKVLEEELDRGLTYPQVEYYDVY